MSHVLPCPAAPDTRNSRGTYAISPRQLDTGAVSEWCTLDFLNLFGRELCAVLIGPTLVEQLHRWMLRVQVFPVAPVNCLTSESEGETELCCNRPQRHPDAAQSTRLDNQVIGQDCAWRFAAMAVSALSDHVLCVVLFGASEQVTGVAAWWVVATVADRDGRNKYGSGVDFPCNTVRETNLPTAVSSQVDVAVSQFGARSSVGPTAIGAERLIDLGPESNRQTHIRRHDVNHIHCVHTIQRRGRRDRLN